MAMPPTSVRSSALPSNKEPKLETIRLEHPAALTPW
jgi:hypothetical protein